MKNPFISKNEAKRLANKEGEEHFHRTKICIEPQNDYNGIHWWDNWLGKEEFKNSIFEKELIDKYRKRCLTWLEKS